MNLINKNKSFILVGPIRFCINLLARNQRQAIACIFEIRGPRHVRLVRDQIKFELKCRDPIKVNKLIYLFFFEKKYIFQFCFENKQFFLFGFQNNKMKFIRKFANRTKLSDIFHKKCPIINEINVRKQKTLLLQYLLNN